MKGFAKGQSGNPAGRKKGTPNKVTAELRELIQGFLESHFDEVSRIWTKASPRDKLAFYRDLLPFVIPRMQNASLDISFDQLSDSDLDKIIDRLIK